ncbi:hypothetical protein [Candidatus Solirubrobacter pratensis]|uniref:hypothetical protein n=1 Tax=Candidatus Solirubrobacter pratensis TaxID=1298857 RepID=UPI000421ED7C|nr:hypothetical protein [Candidatus Solirubrobacter pratensis]
MAEDSFDLDAAGLRAGGADVTTYVEVLARKLEDALPQQTEVRRRSKGLLSREKVVDTIEVTLGEHRYALNRDGEATRAKEVRGVVIKRESVGLDEWVGGLAEQLRELAATNAQARAALDRLVG